MPWAVVAGGAIGGALIGGDAAKSAAKTQAGAADRGTEELRRQYDTSRADFAPYREAGTDALSQLRILLGMSSAPTAPTREQFTTAVGGGGGLSISRALQGVLHPGGFDEAGFNTATEKYNKDLADYNARGSNPDYGSLLRKFSASDLTNDPVYNSSLQFGLNEGEKGINNRAAASGSYDSGATLKALSRYATDYSGTKASDSYSRFTNDQNMKFGRLAGIAGAGQGATSTLAGVGAGTSGNIANLYAGAGNAAGAAQIAQGNAYSGALNNIGSSYWLSKLTGGGQRYSGGDVGSNIGGMTG